MDANVRMPVVHSDVILEIVDTNDLFLDLAVLKKDILKLKLGIKLLLSFQKPRKKFLIPK